MVKIEESPEYETASNLCIIAGEPAYFYKEVMGNIFVKHGERLFGPYTQATFLQDIGGKPTYFASEDKGWALYIEGEKRSQTFIDCAGKVLPGPIFSAKTNEGWVVIKEEKVVAGPYPQIRELRKQGDAIVCAIRKQDQTMCVIKITDKIEELPSYRGVGSPIVINDKLAYPVRKGDSQMLVYDGQELHPYEEISRVMNVSGKLVYTARKDEHWYVISGGKEHGPYALVGMLIDFQGRPTYAAMDIDSPAWEVYQDGELAYDFRLKSAGIGWLCDLDGELGFVYLDKNQWCAVRVGTETLKKEFLSAKLLKKWGEDLVFAAGFGREVARWKLMREEEPITGEYLEILAIFPKEDKIYALVVRPDHRHQVLTLSE